MSSPPIEATLPVRVVVFASEQLFPALQFLLHTAHQFGRHLQSVHIYCTRDDRRSGAPARRLQDVMRRWAHRNGLTFAVDIAVGEMWPAAVRDGLLDWFEAHPDSHWLVNVTGGTKPMSAAAIELTLSTDLQSRRVIYQEIDGQWVELVHDTHGFLTVQQLHATLDAIVPLPDTLDWILSVDDLVATQFSEAHQITTQLLESMPLDEATRQVIALRWKWRDMLQALGVACISGGDAFERYIGAGLIECGVHIKHSLKVVDSAIEGKVVREVDLVGCHRGRLVCIDIKLPGAQDHLKGTQLADVAELAHSLGGRGALAIALRPGWREDLGTRRLADALGVKLLTQAQAPQVFSTLLGWIDSKLTPSAAVLTAEMALRAHQSNGSDVLSNGDVINIMTDERGTLHLSNELERMCEQRGECWALVQMLDQSQYLLAISKRSAHAPASNAWPRVIGALHVELSKIALPGTNGDDRLTETNLWVFGQLKPKPGVGVANLQSSIRNVLATFKKSR
jgi:hypothetical protein